jgi:hypothetical protein
MTNQTQSTSSRHRPRIIGALYTAETHSGPWLWRRLDATTAQTGAPQGPARATHNYKHPDNVRDRHADGHPALSLSCYVQTGVQLKYW